MIKTTGIIVNLMVYLSFPFPQTRSFYLDTSRLPKYRPGYYVETVWSRDFKTWQPRNYPCNFSEVHRGPFLELIDDKSQKTGEAKA